MSYDTVPWYIMVTIKTHSDKLILNGSVGEDFDVRQAT